MDSALAAVVNSGLFRWLLRGCFWLWGAVNAILIVWIADQWLSQLFGAGLKDNPRAWYWLISWVAVSSVAWALFTKGARDNIWPLVSNGIEQIPKGLRVPLLGTVWIAVITLAFAWYVRIPAPQVVQVEEPQKVVPTPDPPLALPRFVDAVVVDALKQQIADLQARLKESTKAAPESSPPVARAAAASLSPAPPAPSPIPTVTLTIDPARDVSCATIGTQTPDSGRPVDFLNLRYPPLRDRFNKLLETTIAVYQRDQRDPSQNEGARNAISRDWTAWINDARRAVRNAYDETAVTYLDITPRSDDVLNQLAPDNRAVLNEAGLLNQIREASAKLQCLVAIADNVTKQQPTTP
jgi:hypothetical protein